MAVVALKPRRGYSFTDHATANPAAPPPGDRLDGEVDRIDRAIAEIIAWVAVSLNPDGSLKAAQLLASGSERAPKPRVSAASASAPTLLGPQSGTHIMAGADPTAQAQDWAEVSFEWAEHMPDTIPPNILATMGITGDHWSSRWWAHRALEIVESITGAPGGIGLVSISAVSPPFPVVGSLWFDTVGGQLYVRYDDGSSVQWVPATNQPAPAAVSVPPPPVAANIVVPVSGATVTLTDARPVYVNNAATLASLTLRLPVVALGTPWVVSFARPVTALGLQTNAGGAIPSAPTSAYGPGAAIEMHFEAPGWIYWK